MSQSPSPTATTPTTARSVLQYWAFNMAGLHNLGISWPGFGYTDPEKQQLQQLRESVPAGRYLLFGLFNTVYVIALAAFVMTVGVIPSALLIDPGHQDTVVILSCLALGVAISVGLGVPVAMGLSALTLKLMGKDNPPGTVPDAEVARLYRKMLGQLGRAALLVAVLFVPFMLFGMTRIGGQALSLLRTAVTVLTPFALVWLVLAAMGRDK